MARYYLITEGTPGVKDFRRHLRVYPNNPPGFLFVDTDNGLTPADLRLPLFRLSRLFEGSRKAFGVSVAIPGAAGALFVSFSLRGLFYPVRVYQSKTQDYLRSLSSSPGFFIEDVLTPTSAIREFSWDSIYDSCERLERLTDSCPCIIDPRECKRENVPKTLHVSEEELTLDFGTISSNPFTRKEYAKLAGFEYLTGAYTTTRDFTESLRPYTDHNLSAIAEKTKEYAERGQQRKKENEYKNKECVRCVFNPPRKSCRAIKYCRNGGIDATQLNLTMRHWSQTRGLHALPYTRNELEFLVRAAGTRIRTNKLTGKKQVDAILAGFQWSPQTQGFAYTVVAAGRPYNRIRQYATYVELRNDFPDTIPENPDPHGIDDRTLLILGVAGHQTYVGNGHLRSVVLQDQYIIRGVYQSNRAFDDYTFSTSTDDVTLYSYTYGRLDQARWKYMQAYNGLMADNRDTQPEPLPELLHDSEEPDSQQPVMMFLPLYIGNTAIEETSAPSED